MSEYLHPASTRSCTDEVHSTVCNDAKTQCNKTEAGRPKELEGTLGPIFHYPKDIWAVPATEWDFSIGKVMFSAF